MKKLSLTMPSLIRNVLLGGFAAAAFVTATPSWQLANAQAPGRAPASLSATVQRHVDGIALEHRGDEKGAFAAYLAAAEDGYPPAQRKLGEIYDSGNSAVVRNYEESIRWYQKAREGGEQIPPPTPHNYAMPPMSPHNLAR
jgi:TPR repeat protein